MNAADEAYARLRSAQRFAAQRIVTPEDRKEARKEDERQKTKARINRKLVKVF